MAPIPVFESFNENQKNRIKELFNNGYTQIQIAKEMSCPRRTIMKLCKNLGLKRDRKAIASLIIKSPLDTPDVIAEIMKIRHDLSLREIAIRFNSSISAVSRLCEKYNISLDKDHFNDLQSWRIQKAWTKEKRDNVSNDVRVRLETTDVCGRLSAMSKKLWENSEYRKRQIEIQKLIWNTPDRKRQLAEMRLNQGGVSNIQEILYNILNDLKIKFYREYRDKAPDPECIIGPYNVDCVIPRDGKSNLIIECQGDYWHSQERHIRLDQSKSTYISRYFTNKYELKYLWEHEFKCYGKIVEMIKYWFGISDLEVVDFDFNQIIIKNATAAEYKSLLSKYHYLPNAGRGGIAFGAFINNEIIATCIFSQLPRQNITISGFKSSEVCDLSRLCINPRYQKRNFASWFVSRCIKSLDYKYKCIISYCDITFNHNGAVYKALNFIEDSVVDPDYWYTDGRGWVMHKKTLYNHATKMGLTENEFADKNGYKRIYGSNKIRFIFKR